MKKIEKLIKNNLRDPSYILSKREVKKLMKDIKEYEKIVDERVKISKKELENNVVI